MGDWIELDLWGMGCALGLMLLTIGLAVWQRLGLTGNIAWATLQTIVQLLVVGYALELVFALQNPIVVLLAIVVLIALATVVTRNRIGRRIPYLVPILAGSLLISTAFTLAYVNLLVLRAQPWYTPQYLVPLAGVLLGNAMNAAAIAGERFLNAVYHSQTEIETHLSLGATPQQATQTYRREAIRAGLLPTLNSMLVVGIATLPGFFAGQIVAGIDPLNAALYQMLVMFILAIATLITTILLIQGLDRQLFNAAAQLKPL